MVESNKEASSEESERQERNPSQIKKAFPRAGITLLINALLATRSRVPFATSVHLSRLPVLHNDAESLDQSAPAQGSVPETLICSTPLSMRSKSTGCYGSTAGFGTCKAG